MNIEMLIEKYQLNNAEAQVLRYMQENKQSLKQMGIREVAKQSFVSTATIVNMSKKIGFSGYSELVFFFQNEPTPAPTFQVISDSESQQFTQLLTNYKDKRIMILGFGFSQNLANYFAEFLNLYGFRATANGHLEFLRVSVENEMLVIVISNSGETRRLIELTRLAVDHRLEVIAFVGERCSSIGSIAPLTISSDTYSPRSFQEFAPNLFFGTALNQFELLMSAALKSIFT
ncbi:hypothetical protein DOK78_001036 [Enterococcus sp. DIV2402]|uniref:Phosphosugar-binding transcriptional regulator n=1 Tax=Candidatus Enterococcus lowellii TaxID=2230877 RepID=A0ABZ2SKN6_9ENTE|nr:MurR/RpiR family transcriptional regulator [Enterococcus sp. DIV2402]MBO0465633.1 MurR/RpiR family transcriptional regulator [Enterococcus sp. DIV2402]